MSEVQEFLQKRSVVLMDIFSGSPTDEDVIEFASWEEKITDKLQGLGLIKKEMFKYDPEDENEYIKFKDLETKKVYVLNVEMGDDIEEIE